MNIEEKKNTISMPFSQVCFGDCFYYTSILFMRINKTQAFNFNSGGILTFDKLDTIVEWIEATLIVG